MAVKDNLQGGGTKATYYLTGNTRINVAYSGKVVKAKLLSNVALGEVTVSIWAADSDIDYGQSTSGIGEQFPYLIPLGIDTNEGSHEVDKKYNKYIVLSLSASYNKWDNINSENVAKVEITIE